MRVRVQPADHGGCGYYRLRWPTAVLAAHGLDATISEKGLAAHWLPQDGHPDRIIKVECDADVVVLQRPMHTKLLESITVLQKQGVAVVVEIDDDFTCLPKGHPARIDTSARRSPTMNRRNLRLACERADLVTCSTPAIGERYAPGHYVVVPNCVPARYLSIEAPAHDGIRVGWTGSTMTHVGDLEVCGDGIARALDGADFHVVGTGVGVARALGIDDDHVVGTGWQEIDDYPVAYAGLDVAIVPLADHPFNQAKSWLKGIEAAALGVPFIASPTLPYCELAQLGAGGLARTPDEWADMVRLLVESPGARAEIAWRGREAAKGMTIEGQAWRWAEAWEHAVMNRREKKAA
jgi:glycosyltransferase involved in cell wall biosynthesis